MSAKDLSIWWGRTAYQIIPDRYYKSKKEPPERISGRILKGWSDRQPNWEPDNNGMYKNDFFYGGDLKGIEEKLDYIYSMGFDMIYLTPIEKSVSYHHYDVGDHIVVDPWLGTVDDFKSLCAKAKELGILIVVDLVFNHTSTNSKYYNNPKYHDWYKKNPDGSQSFWWGFGDLAECNTMNPNYQESMTMLVEKYLEIGADGIRLDLGENLPKEFLFAIERVREKYPNTIFIGEMWNLATKKPDSKIFDGQLDSVMNYPIADAILRWVRWGLCDHFKYNFDCVYNDYPKEVQKVLLNNIGTHDTPNTMTMLGGDCMSSNVFGKRIWDIEDSWLRGTRFDTYGFRQYEAEHDELSKEQYQLARKLCKIAVAIMYNLPGIPCIFQGTEICETGYKDPFNRKPYNWNRHEDDMLGFMTEMGRYRRENSDILSIADVKLISADKKVLIFERKHPDGGKIIVAVNRTENNEVLNLRGVGENLKTEFEIGGCTKWFLSPYGIFIGKID